MVAPKVIIRQRDLSGGQIDASAKRRDDEAIVRSGAREQLNVRILSSGAVKNRPGRTIRFSHTGRVDQIRMSPTAEYRLCFGDGSLTIRDSDGVVIARAWGYDWNPATADQIVWDVYANDVFICFPDQIPKVARWDGESSWTFLDYAPTTTAAGRKLTPFYRFARASIAMSLSALTGTATVSFDGDVLSPGHVGSRFRYYDRQITITAVRNAREGTATVSEHLRDVKDVDFSASVVDQFAEGDIVQGENSNAKLYVTSVTTDNAAGIKLTSQLFSGTETVVGPNGQAAFSAYDSDPTTGPAITVWDEEVMSSFRGYPRSVSVDQNRVMFCDFPGVPGGIAWSTVGDPFNLEVGADPVDGFFEIVPGKSRVLHVKPGADQFIFTDLGIYYIPISETNPLRPGSVTFRRIPGPPSSRVEPVSTAYGVVYVGTGLNRVIGIVGTGQTAQPYLTRPTSDLHSDLFSGVICIEVEDSGGDPPDDRVYAVNADGTIAAGRYDNAKQWVGWVPWNGDGAVSWISALGTELLFSTTYEFGSFAEAVDGDVYLDAAITINDLPQALSSGTQVELLIPDDQGTPIGNMTGGSGLAAAFDGVTSIASIAQQASATSTQRSGNIVAPADILAGDLLVFWQWFADDSTPPGSDTVPSGFTRISGTTESNVGGTSSYKIANGDEGSVTLTGNPTDLAAGDNRMVLYSFRAATPISIVTVADTAIEAVDGNPTAQTVNVTGEAPPLIVFGCYGSSGALDPRTFSTTKDAEISATGANGNAYLAYKIYNTSPAGNTSIDMDDEGDSNILNSFYISVAAPAAQNSASITGAVGKTFGQSFRISKIEVWPLSGLGFTDQSTITISVRAKQGSAPADYSTDGFELGTTGPISDTTSMKSFTSTDETEWDHAWVLLEIGSGKTYVAEVRFYSPGEVRSDGWLWFYNGATVDLMDGRYFYGERSISADDIVTQQGDDFSADTVVAGADWTMRVEPFVSHVQPGQDTGQAMERREIAGAAIAVQGSTGFRVEKWNPNSQSWSALNDIFTPWRVGENQDNEPIAREEANHVAMSGTEYDPRWRVVKDFPGPVTFLELSTKVSS